MATVSSALARLWSTHSTLAPSRAKVRAVARPLPMPSPGLWPAPTTMATRSFRRIFPPLRWGRATPERVKLFSQSQGDEQSGVSPASMTREAEHDDVVLCAAPWRGRWSRCVRAGFVGGAGWRLGGLGRSGPPPRPGLEGDERWGSAEA